MHTLVLVGSGDKNSHSLHLGQAIAASLQGRGAEATVVNLVELGLPLYDRAVERAKTYNDTTARFLEQVAAADAMVYVTPVYHNSYSSILKNALDWMHHMSFDNKVVGLASNGGNRAPVAIDQLMIVARSQHLISSPVRVCTEEDDYDEALNIISPAINERIADFANELIQLATKLSGGQNVVSLPVEDNSSAVSAS